MNNMDLRGCGTALVTPFCHGEVDYETYRSLVHRQIDNGIDFLVALGTTAEAPCLGLQEKIRLLEITKETAGNMTVLAGAGSNSTSGTLETASIMAEHGADGLLVVTPYYNKPTQEGLYRHFSAVADASPLPVVLYNVPGRTGVNLSAETTLRLAQHENIVGVKEASGNYSQICEIIRMAPHGFRVLSGNDNETFPLMACGADGVISVASNIAPAMMSRLTGMLADGYYDGARELHYRLWPLFRNCFVESNPIPVKAGMNLMGLLRNELRLPLMPAADRTCELMRDTLCGLGLI